MSENQSRWHIDLRVEQYLDRLGVEWRYVRDVPIAKIDLKMGLQNQARFGAPLDKGTVEDYAASMRNGYSFPAIVCYMMENGHYNIMGGNHRGNAAKLAQITLFDLYELRVSDESFRRMITQTLNNLEGRRPESEHRLEQAVQWYENGGVTVREAAQRYSVNENTLSHEVRSRKARQMLLDAHISVQGLAKSSMEQLALITNDNAMRAAADLQRRAQMPESDLRMLVAKVRDQRTEAAQVAAVEEFGRRFPPDRITPQGPRNTPSGKARANFFRAVGSIQNLLERYDTRAKLGLSNDDDYQRAVHGLRDALARLERVDATPR